MNDNRYSLSGWLAISLAVLFPLNVVVGVIQSIVGKKLLGLEGPVVGPSDLLAVVFTLLLAYVLYMFKRLLNDRYDFHGVDTLIIVVIWWNVVFTLCSITLRLLGAVMGYETDTGYLIAFLLFFILALTSAGILDILLAARLLQIKEGVDDLLKAFIYVTMASGVAEVTVILSPLAFVLIPVWCVILGMIFLRQREEEQFV